MDGPPTRAPEADEDAPDAVRRTARRGWIDGAVSRCRAAARAGRRHVGRHLDLLRLWLIALLVGVLAAYAAIGFVFTLEILNQLFFGATDATLSVDAADLSPLWLIAVPTLGGAAVGLMLRWAGDKPPLGVADVIEARALRHGCVDVKRGTVSVAAAALSLGAGASAGREGPAVVAGATIAAALSRVFSLNNQEARTILGCAVAAAVSASFNAPIAGALFALEVVLGHYAIRAFAPITIASVAGAVLCRFHIGETPAFALPPAEFGSYAQFPAFFLLGLLSAGVAIAMMSSIFFARRVFDRVQAEAGLPCWTLPAIAGAMIGAVAIAFPEVLSVGYQTTSDALYTRFDFWTYVAIAVAKAFCVAVALGGRFAGGVFSPALMLGALTGAAFATVATTAFPSVSGSDALYALAGMGAVAGAVLGAPISTTLIVFELTGDYDTAIAVMVSTSVATVVTTQILNRSFFHWQLQERNIDLSAGPQSFLLPTLTVAGSMRLRGAEDGASDTQCWSLVEQGVALERFETLATAIPMFRRTGLAFVPVVERGLDGAPTELVGALFHVDALRAYNRALVEVHEEEHS